MTQKQRDKIGALKLEIQELKKKYKNKEIKKLKEKNRKHSCFLCNKSYIYGYVCGDCVSKDIEDLHNRIKLLEREIERR